jgi:pimeloyl-ACP methyl ester carboxylesterase
VRGALGVDQFNLWGGSYGSRVALAYLKAHSGRIRDRDHRRRRADVDADLPGRRC